MSKGVEKVNNGANVGKTYEFDPYMRQQKPFTWSKFIYDDGAVFGRTAKNWGKNFFLITLIILIFIKRQMFHILYLYFDEK